MEHEPKKNAFSALVGFDRSTLKNVETTVTTVGGKIFTEKVFKEGMKQFELEVGHALDLPYPILHGYRSGKNWAAPKASFINCSASRMDQGNMIPAHEYRDEEGVLQEKVEVLVQLLREARVTTAYTGAGISRAAGIPDYASKSKVEEGGNMMLTEPTFAHHTLVALEKQGLLHHWVQQNHDGLPQKAGFPQEKCNEIHGAWFDPSNKVVQFNENLRDDLFAELQEIVRQTDLCLVLGTSLSGMNADRTAWAPARKAPLRAIGSVLINLQRTPLDELGGAGRGGHELNAALRTNTALRIWGSLDEVFRLVARAMRLEVGSGCAAPAWPRRRARPGTSPPRAAAPACSA